MTSPDPTGGDEGRDGGGGALSHTFDWASVRPSTAVVEVVAVATDRAPVDLEPLFETVDPDALDAVVRGDGDDRPADVEVSLRYAGVALTVRSDGEVVVTSEPSD